MTGTMVPIAPSLGSPSLAIRIVIQDARRPLTVSEIVTGLRAISYRFPEPDGWALPTYERANHAMHAMERRGHARRRHVPGKQMHWELTG
jgi:hypothetical protein